MLVECVRQAVSNNYTLFGNSIDRTANGLGVRVAVACVVYTCVFVTHQCINIVCSGVLQMAKILYIFYLSKILEFGDTVIMALKKNYHQISFLHVYHHSSIFCVWWVIVYFAPGGESYFSAALNSGIHVFMCATRDSGYGGGCCPVMAHAYQFASQRILSLWFCY